MASGKAANGAVESEGGGDMAPEEEADVTGRFGRGVNVPTGQQSFDLRGDADGPAVVCVIQRLDAERVAGEEKALLAFVPDGESIHAPELVQHRFAFELVEVQQHFGVTLRGESAAFGLEFQTELAVIVNFAVKGNGK